MLFLLPHMNGAAVFGTPLRKSRRPAVRRLDTAASFIFPLSKIQASHFGNEMETGLAPRRTFHQARDDVEITLFRRLAAPAQARRKSDMSHPRRTTEEAAIRPDRGAPAAGREARPWS